LIFNLFIYFNSLFKLDGGIRDDEKEQLDSILSSISTQSKTGEFYILKNLLTNGEVNYDWPFYPKAEASSVRKYKYFILFNFYFIYIFFFLEKLKFFKQM